MMLSDSFYQRNDVVNIAKELLGKLLVTEVEGIVTSGKIVETEAYAGITDKASHAFGNRRTARTETMYAKGGIAYVYLCYGIHHLFNVVTNKNDIPHAVLIRAIEPMEGIDKMIDRRKKKKFDYTLTAGPGSMSEALGIKTLHNGLSLLSAPIFIEDIGMQIPDKDIISTTRVGVSYAAEDALLPYRFLLKGSKFLSKGKGV
jgi:DNA-3-methyladenine glycosylase